jgi:acetoacetyl-CoA synthetase
VIILCVMLTPGQALDASLEQKIRRTIREQTSPRHVPHHIVQLSEVPVTRSGKPVELSVKALLAGRPISNRESLANPQVLQECERIRAQLLQHYATAAPASTRAD